MSELGPLAREILRRGRGGDDPTPADRARLKRAIFASLAAGGATALGEQAAEAAAATKAGTALSLGGAAWKVFFTLAMVGAVSAGVASQSAPKKLVAISTTNLPRTASEEANADGQRDRQETQPAPAPLPAKAASPRMPSPKAAGATSTAPPNPEPDDTLSAETERLRAAHGALQEGDAARALALLEAGKADAEGQKLHEERAAARVLALCQLGRVEEANAEAAQFLAKNARSPLADRVRKACPKNP